MDLDAILKTIQAQGIRLLGGLIEIGRAHV